MEHDVVPARHPSPRPRSIRRAAIAAVLVAGLATIGVTALGGPASAEEPGGTVVGDAVVTDAAAEAGVPDIEVIAASDCVTYGGSGELTHAVSGLLPATIYPVALVTADDGTMVNEWQLTSADEGTVTTALAPGDYRLSLYERVSGLEYLLLDEVFFTIGACPDIGVAVEVTSCSTGRDGTVLLTLTGLVAGGTVVYDVEGPDFSVGGSLDEYAATEELDIVGMPPGNYYAYVEWQPLFGEPPPPFPVYDWVGFAIQPCQPDVTVAVTECSAVDGAGSALVTVSNLVAGVEYSVWITDAGAPDGTRYGEPQTVNGETMIADPAGGAQLTFSSLPGGRAYSVWIEGVWEAIPPWEEPPFLGNGGNFTPLGTVTLSADADLSTQPCPAAPAAPARPAATAPTTALAATGMDDLGGGLIAAMAMLGLGFAALTARRRRGAGRG